MSKVESGKTVKLNYTGKFENGDVFDTSLEKLKQLILIRWKHTENI